MIGPATSTQAPRTAAIVLAVLACGAAVLGFAGGLIRPSPDFASTYAAIRAVSDDRLANVYDYAALSQLNAAHHYASGALSPFTYPPFVLLVLHPLALLPFEAARVVWSAISYAALLGTALLLADSFARLLPRPDSSAAPRTRALVEAATLPMGNWTLPLLPFAITAAALLLALPLFDAAYWGQAMIIVVFLLALALHATTRRRFWLAGVAAGLAAGLASWTPVIGISAVAALALLAFLLHGYWRAVVWGIGTVALLFVLSLVVVPPGAYAAFSAQQGFLSGVYLTNGHNTSLAGLLANVLTITEHTNTSGLMQGQQIAQLLSWAIAIVSILLASVAGLLHARRGRSARPEQETEGLLWPLLVLLLAVPMLAAPLVWPAEAMLTPFAALVLLGYLLLRGRWSIVAWLAATASAVALLLCIVAAVSGSDVQNLPQGEPVLILYTLRPLAALLVWAGALVLVAGATIGQLRGSGAEVQSQPEPSPRADATAQA